MYIKKQPLLDKCKILMKSPFASALMLKTIEKAEEEDVVEVVRCGKCKYKNEGYSQFGVYYYCSHPEKDLTQIKNESDFCNYGERNNGREL